MSDCHDYDNFPCPFCGADSVVLNDGRVGCKECKIYAEERIWNARSTLNNALRFSELAKVVYSVLNELGIESRHPSMLTAAEMSELSPRILKSIGRRKKPAAAPVISNFHMRRAKPDPRDDTEFFPPEEEQFFDDEELEEIIEQDEETRLYHQRPPKGVRHAPMTSKGVIQFFISDGKYQFFTMLLGNLLQERA